MKNLSNVCNNLRKNPNDVIYTPKPVALDMINVCGITPDMKVLDPCRGGGVFYDNLPECHKDYCEIEEGKDFFDYNERVDLVIGNPPFSIWSKWLEHTCEITDKFCYIIGQMNFTPKRIDEIHQKGYGMTYIEVIRIDWWFSNCFIVIFEKNKPSLMAVNTQQIYCDVCNSRCHRGRTFKERKYGMNECSKTDANKIIY